MKSNFRPANSTLLILAGVENEKKTRFAATTTGQYQRQNESSSFGAKGAVIFSLQTMAGNLYTHVGTCIERKPCIKRTLGGPLTIFQSSPRILRPRKRAYVY